METNIDQASAVEQEFRDKAIKAAASKAGQPELLPKGRCHNPMCDDDLPDPSDPNAPRPLFCPGGDCAREYEQFKRTGGNRLRSLRV